MVRSSNTQRVPNYLQVGLPTSWAIIYNSSIHYVHLTQWFIVQSEGLCRLFCRCHLLLLHACPLRPCSHENLGLVRDKLSPSLFNLSMLSTGYITYSFTNVIIWSSFLYFSKMLLSTELLLSELVAELEDTEAPLVGVCFNFLFLFNFFFLFRVFSPLTP